MLSLCPVLDTQPPRLLPALRKGLPCCRHRSRHCLIRIHRYPAPRQVRSVIILRALLLFLPVVTMLRFGLFLPNQQKFHSAPVQPEHPDRQMPSSERNRILQLRTSKQSKISSSSHLSFFIPTYNKFDFARCRQTAWTLRFFTGLPYQL